MDTVKRRKLTFNEDTCCFCQKRFINNKTVLDPTKSKSLFSASRKRTDEVSINITTYEERILSGEVKLCYHKACRSKHTQLFYNKETKDDSLSENDESSATFTRSHIKTEFSWKKNCFICGDNCSSKHRKTWSKIEGTISETSKLYSKLLEISELKDNKELHTRLLSLKGDLVAVEARYHRNKGCLASYIRDRNIRAAQVLPKKGHLEEAGAILKNQLKSVCLKCHM